ncbi:MAG TPA: alpha/beta hydrolase [Ktedonobacteraceae bacterium]|nr:alpha/beta hydrolase [Ktedonobacteraceae bacterium]
MLPYLIEGHGPPLLLLHGWGVTYKAWQKLAPLLSPHFQLIMVELPGVGGASGSMPVQSYYPACAEALDELRVALGIEQWAMLAYSTGSRVGEAYVQKYALHVTHIVFLCPIYLRRPWKLALDIEEWLYARQPKLANWILSGWRLYGLFQWLGFNLERNGWARECMNEIELQPLDNLRRMLLELPGRGRSPFVLPDSPSVPALFVWGSRDALTTHPPYNIPNEVFIVANHGAPLLVPESVVSVVLPFLKKETVLEQLTEQRNAN